MTTNPKEMRRNGENDDHWKFPPEINNINDE
jgi:hypothetical protein